jgi:hypothetical protein
MDTQLLARVERVRQPSANGYHSLSEGVTTVTFVTELMEDEGKVALADVEQFLRRFIAYPSEHARVAHVLWIAHTHATDAFDSTPRIAFISPEPASGKTRALEVSELLVPRPIEAVNVTAAYLFRKVDDPSGAPTILFDEVDTVFGPKAREHEEVRGLLNAGHRKGAVAGRCVVRGKSVETVEFPAYCAVAMAGLGDLPDTILTRSVVIRMRRRAPSEAVEPFRRRIAIGEGHALRDRLAAWALLIDDHVRQGWPAMPAGVEDRDADVWEALLSVADAAGGDWPMRARAAAVAFVTESKESTPSLGVRLLADLRTVFGDRDGMHTVDILSALQEINEAPWAELVAGKPINARGLSKRLGGYGIKSKPVRIGEKVERGYTREDLADAWERYLPRPKTEQVEKGGHGLPGSLIEIVTTVTPVRPFGGSAASRTNGAFDESIAETELHVVAPNPSWESLPVDDCAGHIPADCARPTICQKLGPCLAFLQSGICALGHAVLEQST